MNERPYFATHACQRVSIPSIKLCLEWIMLSNTADDILL